MTLEPLAGASYWLSELRQHFVVCRKATGLVLAVDQLPVGDDLEDAASTGNQCRLDTESLLNRGRQTGGLWFVVSRHAVGDANVHERFRLKV